MKRLWILLFFIILLFRPIQAGLMINEAVTETASDWVEIIFTGEPGECMDVSPFFVTMYYGTNERLSTDPVSICTDDRPDTGYDDRFVVVHLSEPSIPDETDLTGDTDKNGRLDVYCNNYYGSLWNSDGVVAIDSDDDPSNGGIVDFLVYSNRDSSPNDSIGQYVAAARASGQWESCAGMPYPDCAVFIGGSGLDARKSISRISSADTNSEKDFAITPFVTPGKANIISAGKKCGNIFKTLRKKVPVTRKLIGLKKCSVPVFIYKACSLRFRVFSLSGVCLHRSGLEREVSPGNYLIELNGVFKKNDCPAGLYLCSIDASALKGGATHTETVYLVVDK